MSSQCGSVLQFDLNHVLCSYFCFYFHYSSSNDASHEFEFQGMHELIQFRPKAIHICPIIFAFGNGTC